MLFHTESLTNGLTIEFFDFSNRYFGDYWRVDLEARCCVPISIAGLSADAAEQARRELGEAVQFVRRLERMGVATAEVEATRQAMVETFLASAGPYLESPAFPSRFVGGRLAAKPRWRPYPADRC